MSSEGVCSEWKPPVGSHGQALFVRAIQQPLLQGSKVNMGEENLLNVYFLHQANVFVMFFNIYSI